jgi:hypothetical protein
VAADLAPTSREIAIGLRCVRNLCGYTVYMVHGKDIRYLTLDDSESAVRLATSERKGA